MLEFITHTAQIAAASTVITTAINWRTEEFSWRSVLRNTAAGLLNYPIFTYSKAFGLIAADAIFPLIYGSGPSAFWIPSYIGHNQNRAQFIDYAIDFAPYIILPLGFKLTSEIVKFVEQKGIDIVKSYIGGEAEPVVFSAGAQTGRQRRSRGRPAEVQNPAPASRAKKH